MFSQLLMMLVLFLPGIVAEWYYLTLIEEKFEKVKGIIRALSFSMIILMFRGLVSITRGYGEFPVYDLFSGIGNVTKYILLASFLVVILPNTYVVVPHLLKKMAKGGKNQQILPAENGDRNAE